MWYVCRWHPSFVAEQQGELETLAMKVGYESAIPSWFHRVCFVTPTAKLVDYRPANAEELMRIEKRFNGRPPHEAWYCELAPKKPDGARKTWKHS